MPSVFRKHVAPHTLEAEGYLSDDAYDPGGATVFGVSRNNWPAAYARIMAHDTREAQREEALRFYENTFWNRLLLPQIESLPVGAETFDTAVNLGHYWGVHLLQAAANVIIENNMGRSKLAVDGRMGPNTISAVNEITERYEWNLVALQNHLQGRRYFSLFEGNPARRKRFIVGWMKRTLTLPLKRANDEAHQTPLGLIKAPTEAILHNAKQIVTEVEAINRRIAKENQNEY